MSDSLTRFLPKFDEEAERIKLNAFTREQLIDIAVTAYKVRKLTSKQLEEADRKLERIQAIIEEPSQLARMPGVPSADDLRRKFEEE